MTVFLLLALAAPTGGCPGPLRGLHHLAARTRVVGATELTDLKLDRSYDSELGVQVSADASVGQKCQVVLDSRGYHCTVAATVSGKGLALEPGARCDLSVAEKGFAATLHGQLVEGQLSTQDGHLVARISWRVQGELRLDATSAGSLADLLPALPVSGTVTTSAPPTGPPAN